MRRDILFLCTKKNTFKKKKKSDYALNISKVKDRTSNPKFWIMYILLFVRYKFSLIIWGVIKSIFWFDTEYRIFTDKIIIISIKFIQLYCCLLYIYIKRVYSYTSELVVSRSSHFINRINKVFYIKQKLFRIYHVNCFFKGTFSVLFLCTYFNGFKAHNVALIGEDFECFEPQRRFTIVFKFKTIIIVEHWLCQRQICTYIVNIIILDKYARTRTKLLICILRMYYDF